jgi:hypothetical protein
MGFSPLLHPLHILRAAEVVAVFRFTQPTLLPGPLASLLALRSRTILLASSIPVIGHKQHLAMQTLVTARFGLHQVEAAPLKPRRDARKREEDQPRKKTEKEEKKRL